MVESGGDDIKKRLMVVPNCHVTRLDTSVSQGVGQVVTVQTNHGPVNLPPRGVVVLAAGTIENARLALLSFGGTLGYDLIGTNLVSHMRSNLTFRLPRAVLPGLAGQDLETSALFVKCRKTHGDNSVSHFHLQLTAAGRTATDTPNSEAQLFQQIPDIDTIDRFRQADENNIVMTIRGVAELQAGNPATRVTLSGETDEFGVPRAFVSINPNANDGDTWNAMDSASDAVRQIFAAVAGSQDITRNRDGLGTTHHEAGTLRMGCLRPSP